MVFVNEWDDNTDILYDDERDAEFCDDFCSAKICGDVVVILTFVVQIIVILLFV
jgi:hypothetical protein